MIRRLRARLEDLRAEMPDDAADFALGAAVVLFITLACAIAGVLFVLGEDDTVTRGVIIGEFVVITLVGVTTTVLLAGTARLMAQQEVAGRAYEPDLVDLLGTARPNDVVFLRSPEAVEPDALDAIMDAIIKTEREAGPRVVFLPEGIDVEVGNGELRVVHEYPRPDPSRFDDPKIPTEWGTPG